MIFANPLLRRPALAVLFAVWPSLAMAQDQVINVYFQPLKGAETALLNKAIQSAFSQPPFQLAGRPFAGVLVIAVSGKVEVAKRKVSGTSFDFTVTFTRDGSSLGESAQSCREDALSECTDQLVQDAKSVSGQH